MTVLLTDAQLRKTLAAIRSLGNKGIDIIASEDTRWTTSSFSKFCRRGMVYPKPSKEPDAFYEWLRKTINENSVEVLFPMDDNVMDVVIAHKEELQKLCRMLLPDAESYNIASDKGLAVVAAQKSGLDCPETWMPKNEDDLLKLESMVADLAFPLVIKPRKSNGSRGIVVVNKREDFVEHYLQVHQRFSFPLIQEYIRPGPRFDVCLLFNSKSELRASFVQKELRHFPLDRGPSTMQESVWLPDLIELAVGLLKDLNWQGIAEVEFMLDEKDGKFKFMEINPRFWNSLYLSMLAGVDFPWLLYRLIIEGDVPEVSDYRTDVKCRWSLPGDILHFLVNKNRFRMDPPLWAGKKSGVYDDVLSLSDPGPTVGFIMACLHFLPDREMWKQMFDR